MASTAKASTETPKTCEDIIDRGIHAVRRLPIVRSTGGPMSPTHLRDLLHIVKAYLDAPTTTHPPTKRLLAAAVQSLLEKGKSLSAKWDKTQLCLVLKKWILSALRLSPFSAQPSLLVRVTPSKSNGRHVDHSCFIKEGEDEIFTFAMASPSPVKPREPSAGNSDALTNGTDETAPEEFGPSAYDEDFLREIDDLALDTSIGESVIPTIFYTPRVSGENGASSVDGSGQLDLAYARNPSSI